MFQPDWKYNFLFARFLYPNVSTIFHLVDFCTQKVQFLVFLETNKLQGNFQNLKTVEVLGYLTWNNGSSSRN